MAATFARDSAFNAIAGLSTTLSGFLSTILVARLLGVEGAGIVAFATFIVTVVIIVTDLGLSGALVRYLPELRARGETEMVLGLTRYLFRRLALTLVITSACFAAYASFVAWRHPSPPPVRGDTYLDSVAFWAIVGSACLVQALASFAYGYLRGTESFRELARVAVVGGALQVATTLIGGWSFGIAGAMVAAVLGSVVPALLILAKVPRRGRISPEMKERVNRFALESWASYLVTAFAWSRMEIFFLERSWGSDAAGLFGVSLTLANLATQAPMLLAGALLPYLSRHAGEDSAHKRQEAYAVGMRLMAFIVFPSCFGAAAITPRLLPTLFGSDFARAVPTAVILVSAAAFSASASVAMIYLFAMERTRIVLATGAVGAVLSVLVGLLAVPLYGATAAAIGRGSIQAMIVAVAVWYIDRRLGCRTPYNVLFRLLAAALACGAAAFLVLQTATGPQGLPAAVLTGMVVYVVAVKIAKALPRDDIGQLVAAANSTLPSPLRAPVIAVLRFMGPSDPKGA